MNYSDGYKRTAVRYFVQLLRNSKCSRRELIQRTAKKFEISDDLLKRWLDELETFVLKEEIPDEFSSFPFPIVTDYLTNNRSNPKFKGEYKRKVAVWAINHPGVRVMDFPRICGVAHTTIAQWIKDYSFSLKYREYTDEFAKYASEYCDNHTELTKKEVAEELKISSEAVLEKLLQRVNPQVENTSDVQGCEQAMLDDGFVRLEDPSRFLDFSPRDDDRMNPECDKEAVAEAEEESAEVIAELKEDPTSKPVVDLDEELATESIAEQCEVSDTTLKKTYKYSDDFMQSVARYYLDNDVTLEAVAKKFDIGASTLCKYGNKFFPDEWHAKTNTRHLSDDFMRSVIDYYLDNDITAEEVAVKFGVGVSTIHRYKNAFYPEDKKTNATQYSDEFMQSVVRYYLDNADVSVTEVAVKFGVSVRLIRFYGRKYFPEEWKIKTNCKQYSDEFMRSVVRYYLENADVTINDVAEKFGVSDYTIKHRGPLLFPEEWSLRTNRKKAKGHLSQRKCLGVKHGEDSAAEPTVEQDNPSSQKLLTFEQQKDIVDDYLSGRVPTTQELLTKYSISESTFRKCMMRVYGDEWKNKWNERRIQNCERDVDTKKAICQEFLNNAAVSLRDLSDKYDIPVDVLHYWLLLYFPDQYNQDLGTHYKYSNVVKQECVKDFLTSGESITSFCTNVKLCRPTLYSWLDEFKDTSWYKNLQESRDEFYRKHHDADFKRSVINEYIACKSLTHIQQAEKYHVGEASISIWYRELYSQSLRSKVLSYKRMKITNEKYHTLVKRVLDEQGYDSSFMNAYIDCDSEDIQCIAQSSDDSVVSSDSIVVSEPVASDYSVISTDSFAPEDLTVSTTNNALDSSDTAEITTVSSSLCKEVAREYIYSPKVVTRLEVAKKYKISTATLKQWCKRFFGTETKIYGSEENEINLANSQQEPERVFEDLSVEETQEPIAEEVTNEDDLVEEESISPATSQQVKTDDLELTELKSQLAAALDEIETLKKTIKILTK